MLDVGSKQTIKRKISMKHSNKKRKCAWEKIA